MVRLVALEYEPPLHGRAAAAPSAQYEPGVHGSHTNLECRWVSDHGIACTCAHDEPALVDLVLSGRALGARAHLGAWRYRAGAALGLLGAARRREVARVGLVALVGASEVGRAGVRALHARQRRAGARRAVRAALARHAGLPALVGLVLAGLALDARAHLGARCDRAGATLGLLGAARRRVEAESGSSALVVTGEVGEIGVGARLARQRRARALGAVRASGAWLAHLLARLVLVGARVAPIARPHACLWCNGSRATWRLVDAACRRVVTLVGGCALAPAGEVGGAGVRALATRQRRAGACRAVRARCAGFTCHHALLVLVSARLATFTRALAFKVGEAPWEAVGARRCAAAAGNWIGLASLARAARCAAI
eukprot:scaffold17764_cov66-Phaeocystis_antarctica.AAC.5